MFGSDRFAFETPNVIDPGDLPPSQPPRGRTSSSTNNSNGSNESGHSHTASTHDDGSSSDDDLDHNDNKKEEYKSVRDSTARLLKDISDLDLSPTETELSSPRPYDPYDDDDEEQGAGGGGNHHSLPGADEARRYATRLLVHSNSPKNRAAAGGYTDRPNKKLNPRSPFNRTIQLDAPSHSSSHSSSFSQHLVRKRLLRLACRFLIVAALVGVVLAIGVAVSNKKNGNNGSTTVIAQVDSKTRQQRRDDIEKFVTETGISSSEDLRNADSPQALAAQWMAGVDPLQIDVPSTTTASSSSSARFVQRYVLAVWYYALGGNNSWKKDYNFLSATDECSWYEETVVVDHVQQVTALGVSCNEYLEVRNLYMPSNGLQGTVPSELSRLSRLDLLAVPDNHIMGRLPTELSSLTDLVYLDVKYNQVSGFVPEWIGDLDQLEVLGLSNNQLAGTVPPSFGTLGRLKTLALDDNALTGSLDFSQHLTNLEFFWADRNLLTGVVDADFFASHYRLQQLDLSFNNLEVPPTVNGDGGSGVFPQHLLQHPTLRVLDLSDTSLIDMTLPELDVTNNVLEYLSARNVGLAGSIPDSFSNLRKLTHLDLFGNLLTGLLPNTMGEMVSLTYLSLGNNPITANQEFPPFLSQLIKLRELSLTQLQLSGLIPSWIRYLTELKLLDLSENGLAGPIPQTVWDLPDLSYLLLHENALTGTVPSDAVASDQLKIVSLYHNQLSNEGSLDHFCESNAEVDMLAADCSLPCSDSCCQQGCCQPDDDDCFTGKVSTYLTWYEGMWEFNYTRASYSFDPAILAEAAVAQVIGQQAEYGAEDPYVDEDYWYGNNGGNRRN